MTPRRALFAAYGIFLLAIVVWFVADFPLWRGWIALGFLLYAVALWRWPVLWLYALPALLPLFDLAPWSGRFFFDEFDALVLLTAGILALRDPGEEGALSRTVWTVIALLCASYAISALIVLWPPPKVTADSFANYDSPYNALRVGKGFLWALLLLRPMRQAAGRGFDIRVPICRGLLVGLAGVALVSLYERWLFTGVLTWVTTYRTTASFSSMHTGDGHIDVFLATTIPLIGLMLIGKNWLKFLPLTAALALGSAYALWATQSRAPVIAVALAVLVGAVSLLLSRDARLRKRGGGLTAVLAIALLVVVSAPVLSHSSFAERFSTTRADALFRIHHWKAALALRSESTVTKVFGAGLGTFPRLHHERSVAEKKAAKYEFVSGREHFLRLWSGLNLYMGQDVGAEQNQIYTLMLRLRSPDEQAGLTVAWCELWMLASRNCTWDTFVLAGEPGAWQTFSKIIDTKDVGSGRNVAGLFFERPTRLTYYISVGRTLDVGSISLKDASGRELVQNGQFERGADHWFWAVDDHYPWHTKNLAVNILFDQGWFGLFAVGYLIVLTLGILFAGLAGGDALVAPLLASFTGFLVTGVTVSTFDQPRLTLMFYLLCFAIIVSGSAKVRHMPEIPGVASR